MKFLLPLVCLAFLSSCAHTAVAPVSTPGGVPVAIRVPGVAAGTQVTAAQLAAIDQKVDEGMAVAPAAPAQDPRILDARIVGAVGDMTTKSGRRFVGYVPFILIRSTYPAAEVDRAAGLAAAAAYRSAKKSYELIPLSEVAEKPKTEKP